jgi:transposase
MSKPAVYKSRRWMHKRYVIDKMTEEEIAKLAGTNQSTINRWLRRLELKR